MNIKDYILFFLTILVITMLLLVYIKQPSYVQDYPEISPQGIERIGSHHPISRGHSYCLSFQPVEAV